MYRFWDLVTRPILEALEPSVVLEVGSDEGPNTRLLLDYCRERGGVLHVIDPFPKYDVAAWRHEYGEAFVFHRDLSLNVLSEIDSPDLALIDGDHNWYTVFNELKLLEQNARNSGRGLPVMLLHDVGWPYGRRDLYYEPKNIPPEHRHTYRRGGLEKGRSAPQPGDGLNGLLYNADHEGGERNGVLTAVEDFIVQATEPLELLEIPAINGLGVLIPKTLQESNQTLGAVIRSFEDLWTESSRSRALVSLAEEERLKIETALANLNSTNRKLRSLNKDLSRQVKEFQDQRIAARDLYDDDAWLRVRNQDLEKALASEEARVQRMVQWIVALNRLFSQVLSSRQWKAGQAAGEVYRRLLRRPRSRSAAQDMVEVFKRFSAWRVENNLKVGAKDKGEARRGGGRVSEAGDDELRARVSAERKAREQAGKAAVEEKARTRISREVLISQIRERLGSVPTRDDWPFVSMVVLNRNGLSHLEVLFEGLSRHTDYPAFEVIVVDNGSSDGSVEFLKASEVPFEVKVIENKGNTTFSDGNNQGVEAASGDLLLFLNNDVEPMDDGWLKEMVDCAFRNDAAAVGAYLLYGEALNTESGYAVQHRGIKFFNRVGFPQYYNLGNGEDALGSHLGAETASPGATAACLLMRRDVFREVGGFTTGYKYGTEDVDLGLKVTAAGHRILTSGRAVLFHHELSSQRAEGNQFVRMNRQGNRLKYAERWGPKVQNALYLDGLGERRFWTDRGAHMVLTVTSNDPADGYGDWYTAHELGDALEKRGLRVSYVAKKSDHPYSLPEDANYLIVLLDTYDVSRVSGVQTIAWIRNWTDRWVQAPWFEGYDHVLASSAATQDIVARSTGKRALLFPIATNPERFHPRASEVPYEADYVFTGNSWGVGRKFMSSLDVAPDETFLVFGKGWDEVPQMFRHLRGHVPYEELPKIYPSAKVAVDDAAISTMPYGSVNSRVFDALASGTVVLTNGAEGVRELFDEDFPTYSSREEFRAQIDRLLGDEPLRKRLSSRYRDIVLQKHTYERRAEELVSFLREEAGKPSFCIKIGAPNWEVAQTWGDLPFAKAMRKQLHRKGYRCVIHTLDSWDSLDGLRYDVTVHLKGLTAYTPKPGQFNVLWNISHPDMLLPQECDRYDLVFVASERWAEEIQQKTQTPVYVMEQATDPEVFFPDFDKEHEREIVFVGNSRKVHRRIVRDILPTERDFAIWGGDWEEFVDEKYVAGDFLPGDQVRKAYSSAAIVLNDHWDDMREHGFISNRIYDALACGALVISDDLPELQEKLDGAVVTYGTPEELKELVSYYLAHPEERAERGTRGKDAVLSEYTFEQRIEFLLKKIAQRTQESGFQKRNLSLVSPDKIA